MRIFNLTQCSVRGFFVFALFLLTFISCGSGEKQSNTNLNDIDPGVFGPNVSGTPQGFRGAGVINDNAFLIGGPVAQGRQGDILLQNDKIRLIIQKPGRNTGVGLFGGNIIDADIMRSEGQQGRDNFATFFPLVNVSWTVNVQKVEILNHDFSQGPVVIRTTGVIDVYDYIQANIIKPLAKMSKNNGRIDVSFETSFDDLFDPFTNIPSLKNISPAVVTDYTLKQDKNYVIVETHLFNQSESENVKMVVGDWINGSGTLEPFIPGTGFLNSAIINSLGALLFGELYDNVGVSYGYFYNPLPFQKEDGTFRTTGGMFVSGVFPIGLGESLIGGVLPIAEGSKASVKNELVPGTNTFTRYFVVGNGDLDSVLRGGFEALGVSKVKITGNVKDYLGSSVSNARVVVLEKDSQGKATIPVSVIKSKNDGSFEAYLSSGADEKAKLFGSGQYSLEVFKEGYLESGSSRAGSCGGGSFDQTTSTFSGIACTLGSFGTLTVSASENGQVLPARITIAGFDPSSTHSLPIKKDEVGKYTDVALSKKPYGVVDMLYLGHQGKVHPQGNPRVISGNKIRLEPGEYIVYVTRGIEYSVYSQKITMTAGAQVEVNANLNRVLATPGFISADLHLHAIRSADSPFGLQERVYGALGEGMDVLVSTDHDFVTDYAPIIDSLGVGDYLTSMAGDEITPLAIGHFLAFPLTPDPSSTTGGAYDYTYKDSDEPAGPGPDRVQSPAEFLKGVDEQNPGTQVLQVAHIIDNQGTGNFLLSGLVTSTLFSDAPPLSTFSNPINFRLSANTNTEGNFQAPYPVGTNPLFTLDFTSMELTIGAYDDTLDILMTSTLPTYFNLLNLGVLRTATASSDSHQLISEPLGSPRNYLMSSVDPRDGLGDSFSAISPEEVAVNTNAHRVVVSNGPFITVQAKSSSQPEGVTVGGNLLGGDVTLTFKVESNEYIDWDQIEIYTNTDTVPATDDMTQAFQGPAQRFHNSIRIPGSDETRAYEFKYFMQPSVKLKRGIDFNQTLADGLRSVTLTRQFNFDEDTWIVILARGTNNSRGLFPFVTRAIDDTVDQGQVLARLESGSKSISPIKAFAFTNPIFVDVDGDGFKAKHIRNGKSPLANQ